MNAAPGFRSKLARVGVVRLFGIGFPLLLSLGLVLAFHFEVGKKHFAPWLDFSATVCLALGLAAVYAVLVRLFEGRWPAELALRPGMKQLAAGTAIGFGLFSAVYAVLTALGVATWQGFNGFGEAAPLLLLAIIGGIGEELLFRGVIFRLLEESFGTFVALAASAALFGLMHAGNKGATVGSSAAVALEAGVMLAAAYAWTRNLWLPIGIHLAWNFTEGGIYGAAVSGESAPGIVGVELSRSAPDLITGGTFGPEASIVAVGVCCCAGAAFLVAAVRAGQWRGRSFRLMLDRA